MLAKIISCFVHTPNSGSGQQRRLHYQQ